MHTIKKKKGLFGNSILLNLVAIIVIGILLLMLVLFLLKIYTRHGHDVKVPKITGLQVREAVTILKSKELEYTIIDSLYRKDGIPGAIIEQTPEALSKVKKGRAIYITVYSRKPQQIAVPGLVDFSARQAEAMLNSMGFNQITIQQVPSEYAGLVISVEYRGRKLRAEEKVPIGSPLTLVVGSGLINNPMNTGEEYTLSSSETQQTESSATENKNLEDEFF